MLCNIAIFAKCSYKYKKYGNYNEVRKIIDKLNIIADEKYIKGIKILEKDKGNNYSEAINYFSKYIHRVSNDGCLI